jgi:hypothetical protein
MRRHFPDMIGDLIEEIQKEFCESGKMSAGEALFYTIYWSYFLINRISQLHFEES